MDNRGMVRGGVCCLLAIPIFAQTTKIPSDLRFEVASFKSTVVKRPDYGIRPAPGGQRYEAWNCPIEVMIQAAYRVKPEQIVGGPGWLRTDPYDMEAKAEKPSSAEELHGMLINLLVDRLALKFHRETRDMRRYSLTLDQGGPKLTPHPGANPGELWIDQSAEKILHIKLKGTASPMDYFAYRLSLLLDLPVVDRTGLTGAYDFTVEYTRDLPVGFPPGAKLNGEEPDTSGPRVFQAVKQQLGLELKADKGPVDVIVIDSAERPAGN